MLVNGLYYDNKALFRKDSLTILNSGSEEVLIINILPAADITHYYQLKRDEPAACLSNTKVNCGHSKTTQISKMFMRIHMNAQ